LRYGREITHQDIGMRIWSASATSCPTWRCRAHAKLEGRQMIMVLAPKKK